MYGFNFRVVSSNLANYPDTEPTSLFYTLIMLRIFLGGDKNQFWKSLVWHDRELNSRLLALEHCVLPIRPPHPVCAVFDGSHNALPSTFCQMWTATNSGDGACLHCAVPLNNQPDACAKRKHGEPTLRGSKQNTWANYSLDAVAESVERRFHVWKVWSSNPIRVKLMTNKIDTCRYLAWCSILIVEEKDWSADYQDTLTEYDIRSSCWWHSVSAG